ncbi:MAG: hypothetical protein KGJ93_03580 [Patescibacteria group bacterium]|nr:hypothetical protein [Patescibacteria group bacterium]
MLFFEKLNFQNFDLLSVGISMAAIGILGFVIFFNDRKKATAQSFLCMCLTAILWSSFNYLSYQFDDPPIVLWFLRFAVFFAVWFSYYIFLLFYSFPTESSEFGKVHKYLLLPATIFVSVLNLSPFVFKNIKAFAPDGRVSQVENGPGIIIFGLTVVVLIALGAGLLVKKMKHSSPEEKKPIFYVLLGITTSSVLLIIFNYVFPALLNQAKFVPLGAVFLFPFVALTAYAVFKHRLFNVKIVATEILVFLLSIGLLFDVMLASSMTARVFRFIVFLLVLVVGILLIRSVQKEVQQREQLEALTKQLAAANEQLKALDQARSEFITIASHQLRTPPATIKWYLSAVLNGDYGRVVKAQREILEKTNRTNNSLISLIDDMLNVSRIERGKMEFLFEPADLLSLAELTHEQLLPIAQEKHLALTFNKPKKIPQLMADKEKIRQVMNNLIDNAIKYTKTGSIAVKLSATAEEVRFEVKDTGKGISPEEQNSIFEKFSRGKESIKQSAGLGLGLYVAKIVIAQHKGKIWAESGGKDQGSTFIFTLPIHNDLRQTTLLDLTKNQ